MAAFLCRLGRMAFRRRWYFALLWVAVLIAVGVGAMLAPSAHDDGFSVPGTESQKAQDLVQQRFPDTNGNAAFARIVFVAPNGEKLTAQNNRAAITKVVAEIADDSQVATAVNPFQADAVSKDGTTAYANITYKKQADDLTDTTKQSLRNAIQDGKRAGLTVEVGGTALATQASVGGASEIVGIAVAAVVLLATFGSLAAAGLPLLTAMIGVGVGAAGITAMGSTLGLSGSTTALATMLGLAVGIDYAVFIISRYREERGRGQAPHDAVGLAVGTAGSSVVFAGLTVVIGLAGLSVVGIPMLTKMGLAAAAAVIVAVLIALTLVPALLGLFPRAVLPRAARKGRNPSAKPNAGSRWAQLVLKRPVPVLMLGVATLAIIAVPVTKLHLGTAGDESKPTSTTERRAYDDLTRGFGPGSNGPLTIVVDATTSSDPKATVQAIETKIADTKGIASVSAARFDPAGTTAVFSAIPSTAPDAQATTDLIHTIRAERGDAPFMVSGLTASNIDSAAKVQDALIPYLAVVVGLAFLLLLVVFRSVLVPLKAAFGFLLSVLAAIGAVVAVFQWGWLASLLGVHQTGPIMSLMPIFMVGIIFGLAMDYEVFLVSRVREAYLNGEQPGPAIVSGFRSSTRVVAAAALIMMAVFSGFIGAGDPMIKMIGFGMAIAVMFDAFVVRMAIVPAVLTLLGKRAWWLPRWLDRVLPRVDLDGEALSQQAPAPERPVLVG
jgi:putative drug exporter of the RND superfamily